MALQEEQQESLTEAETQYLLQETDHFFQAELGHDQRASWLLALCSAIILAIANYTLGSSNTGEINPHAFCWFQISLIFLSISIIFTILSLWPLAGKQGKLWNTFYKSSNTNGNQNYLPEDWIWQHYHAHRHRTKKKANFIILGILFLLPGFISALLGIIMSIEGKL